MNYCVLFPGKKLKLDEVLSSMYKFNDPFSAFDHVKSIKDDGNSSFKKGNFEKAYTIYDNAAKLLTCLWSSVGGNSVQFRELAFSLNLNIAACAIKLEISKKAMGSGDMFTCPGI